MFMNDDASLGRLCAAGGVAALLLAGATCQAGTENAYAFRVTSLEYEPLPDGSASYRNFMTAPVLSESGAIGFRTRTTNGNDALIWIGRSNASVLARTDPPFWSVGSYPALNAGGDVRSRCRHSGVGGLGAIYEFQPGVSSDIVLLEGELNACERRLDDPTAMPSSHNYTPFNEIGQSAVAEWWEADGGADSGWGIFRIGANERCVISTGDVIPGLGAITDLGLPALNDHGAMAFVGAYDGGAGDGQAVLYVGDDDDAPVVIARPGTPMPGSDPFDYLYASILALNNAGTVAFSANTVGSSSHDGVWCWRNGALEAVATNQSGTVNHPGELYVFQSDVLINESDEILFGAKLYWTDELPQSAEGVFFSTGAEIHTVILEDQEAPGGGEIWNIIDMAMNDHGLVVITVTIDEDPPGVIYDEYAILTWTQDAGLQELIRTGTPLPGMSVDLDSVSIRGSSRGSDPVLSEQDAVNNHGEIAFAFSLRESLAREGTAIYGRPVIAADLNDDGVVDFSDLLMLLSQWGSCSACPADLDGDGVVGFGDLLLLLAQWTVG